jgi:hypothetical protein
MREDSLFATALTGAFLSGLLLWSVPATPRAADPVRDPARHVLPDPKLTPGAVLTTDMRDVCTPGWASAHRHVTAADRRAVLAAYGMSGVPADSIELDHSISLQLGGSNDRRNLWPQWYHPRGSRHPELGAYAKDSVENWLHKKVCAGEVALPDVQRVIAADWRIAYRYMHAELAAEAAAAR